MRDHSRADSSCLEMCGSLTTGGGNHCGSLGVDQSHALLMLPTLSVSRIHEEENNSDTVAWLRLKEGGDTKLAWDRQSVRPY